MATKYSEKFLLVSSSTGNKADNLNTISERFAPITGNFIVAQNICGDSNKFGIDSRNIAHNLRSIEKLFNTDLQNVNKSHNLTTNNFQEKNCNFSTCNLIVSRDKPGNLNKIIIDSRNSLNKDSLDDLSIDVNKIPEVTFSFSLPKNKSKKAEVEIDSRNMDVVDDLSEETNDIAQTVTKDKVQIEQKLMIDSQNLTGSSGSSQSTETFPEMILNFSDMKANRVSEKQFMIDSQNLTVSSGSSQSTETFPEMILNFSDMKANRVSEKQFMIDSQNLIGSRGSLEGNKKFQQVICGLAVSKNTKGNEQKLVIDSLNATGQRDSNPNSEMFPEIICNVTLSKRNSSNELAQKFKIDSQNVAIAGDSRNRDEFMQPFAISSKIDVCKTVGLTKPSRNSDKIVLDEINVQKSNDYIGSAEISNLGHTFASVKDLNRNEKLNFKGVHEFSPKDDIGQISLEESQKSGEASYMAGQRAVLQMRAPFSATSEDEWSHGSCNPVVLSSSEIMVQTSPTRRPQTDSGLNLESSDTHASCKLLMNQSTVEADYDFEGRRRYSGQSLSEARPSTTLQYNRLPTYVSTHSLYGRNDRYTGSGIISPYNLSQPIYTSGFDGSMSKYTSNASNRTTRSYQSPRSTRTADINTKSYDSPTRKNDVTSTRSYDSPSRLSQPRSGQSSRSSSVSSTLSETSSRGDIRQSSSSHLTPSQTYGTSAGTSRTSRYGGTQFSRVTRNGSGNEAVQSNTVSARSLRGSESDMASPKSTESERKRFGFTGSKPLSEPNKDGKTSIDIVAERFGGIETRRSLREKQDDKSRFGTAATRRSARNVTGEAADKINRDSSGSSVSRFGAPLRKTHKTMIPEADEQPVQLRGREIQKVGSSQVVSRTDAVTKPSQFEENKERFGGAVLRRSLRDTNGNRHSSESVKSDSSRGTESIKQTDRHISVPLKDPSRNVDSTEDRAGKSGTSALKSRMQKFSGQSKSTGAEENISPSDHKTVPTLASTSVGLGLAESVQKSDGKVTLRSSDRSGTPAENFLRRAEMRSSLRQQSREIAASTEQTLAGDVFKRGSLRSTLPLKKEPFESGSFERTETRRSLRDRGSKYSEISSSSSTIEDESKSQQSRPPSSFVESKRSELMTKAASESENVDRFGRSTSRKALQDPDDRPVSSPLESKISTTGFIAHASSDGALAYTDKPLEDSLSHSTPNRSRIPKRNEVDTPVPPTDNRLVKSTEILDVKSPGNEFQQPAPSTFLNVKLDEHSSKSSSEGRLTGHNLSARKQMPTGTPGSAIFLDTSVVDSFSETPSESREERISKYKAERRKQLANRFQDSPVSQHFIKTDDSKEEKSKGGLVENFEIPQKLGDEKMVLNFDSEVSSGKAESLQTQSEETMFKRPRPAEGLGEIEVDAKPKRRKSDDDDPPPTAKDIRDKLRRLQISAATIKSRAHLAEKASAVKKEQSSTRPREEEGKLKVSTSQAKGQLSPSEEVQPPRSPKREESKISAPSQISVQTKAKISLSVEEIQQPMSPKKVGRFEDHVPADVSPKTIEKELSPQPQVATLRYSMRDESITMPEDVAAAVDNDVDQAKDDTPESSYPVYTDAGQAETEPLVVPEMIASPASIKTSSRLQADIVSVGKLHSKSEVIEFSPREDYQKEVPKTFNFGISEPERYAKSAHIVSPNKSQKKVKGVAGKVSDPEPTVTVERKVAQVAPFRQEPVVQEDTREMTETNLQTKSQKAVKNRWQSEPQQQYVDAEVYQQAEREKEQILGPVDTMEEVQPQSPKGVSSNLKSSQQKGSEVKEEQKLGLSQKTAPSAQQTEVKSTAQHEPLVQSLKSHHHISASLKTDTGLKAAADEKILPVIKTEPATPVRSKERPKDAEKKTPVKALKDEVSQESKTPESPDNLDELLKRNQKYLEAEVKKKLQRQQHVVGSSSSEAEKSADGTLAPGGSKKKRISPQMRRRIKERSKSRERSEAEKEAIKKAQEVSAAELLASPEMKLPAEIGVSLHEGQTEQHSIMDLKEESKKPTDSDSTITSLTESLSLSVTGSEERAKRKRKDKSSSRKSQLNAQDSTSGSQETSVRSSEQIALESSSTPKGQRSSERTKTTPVTPEEVQLATEQVAKQREQRIAESEETVMKTSMFEGRISSHDLAKRELRPMGIAPNRVSSALSKFQNSATVNTETRPKTIVDDTLKASKPFARGKDFSSLLEKFSSSDSSEETERQRRIRVNARRLDFPSTFSRGGTPSSDESNTEKDRPRRTPERTGSLKERAKKFEGGAAPKIVQRSSSFKSETAYKSDFMKRVKQQQQEEQEEAPKTKSPKESETKLPTKDMGATLSKPTSAQDFADSNNAVEAQIDKSPSKFSIISEDTNMDEVIADPELRNALKTRRKNSDAEFHDAFEDLANGRPRSRPSETDITEVIADQEVARVLAARRKDTDSKTIEKEEVFEDTVESLETKAVSSVQSSSTKYSKVTENQTEVVQKTKIESKPPSGITTTAATTTTKSTTSKNIEWSRKQELQRSQTLPERGIETETVEISASKSPKVSTTVKSSETTKQSTKPLSSAGSIEKQDSVEKPVRGILKRSSSSASDHGRRRSDSENLLDPELAKVLQNRKKMVDSSVPDDNDEEKNFEDRRDLIRREIAQTEIHKTEECGEEERSVSISERIFRMENKIEEAKSCPVTPRTLSGFTTPRSRNRSGASTPRRDSLESLPEESPGPKINTLLSADKQFMAKLERMAETETQISEKRKKFNRRTRDDWRTRTLPVTLEEIQEADSLESVSSFRGLIRKKATINIFEKIQEQDKLAALNKPTEYPQRFSRKEKKSRRSGRFKTAPITAEELGSIPEGHTLLDPLRHLHAPLSAATSKADSGILSGSDNDRDSIQSDSLRSLEMEIPEDDPTRLSVSARTSIFKQLEEEARTPEKEKPKYRSIGAKRMIEKKKRERSLTQPITEDEVKTASEIADTEQKSQAIQTEISELKAASTKEEGSSESEDNLSRMSLADKLKLFNKKPEERTQAPPPRSDAPVIRRRNRKQASRFNTQPVTTEEVEKASKISPLALSMSKPPDNELLRSLPIAAQIEMMAMHAEANLSQPSSRAGSQPSSRAGSQPNSRRNSVGTEDSGILKTSENKDQQEVKSILKHDGRKSSDSEIRGILKDGGKDNVEPKSILKHGDSEGDLVSPEEPSRGILKHGDANDTIRGQKSALRRDSKGKSEGDLPRSILKRDSLEENKIEPDKGVLKKSRSQDFKESTEIRGILKKTPSTEVKSASCEVTSRYSTSVESVQRSSTVEASVVSQSSQVSTEVHVSSRTEEVSAHVSETVSSTKTEINSAEDSIEIRKTSKIKNEAVARRRSRENRKAEGERYLTQPADTGASDKTPERKMKYGASRHHTQPITPEEKEAAEASGSSEMSNQNSGSITERLNQLKKSGEEDWKRRVKLDIELPDKVKMRVKLGPTLERPTSIAERLNKLGESQQRWTARVEETDVKAFTVEGKQSITLDSPLTTKKRRLPKRELSFGKGDSGQSNGSSPLQSPSSEKIPLPKELISEGPPVISIESTSSSSSKTVVTRTSSGSSDDFKTNTVEVPEMEESFDSFFSMVEEKMLEEKLDVTVDDFDELFLKSEDVLMPTRRIRPKRRHIAQKRNPIKNRSVEIQQEYIEVRTGVAEMELKRIKREGFARDSSSAQVMLAEAAVKGLQSKESFNIELRSTKDSKVLTPGHTDYLPYSNLMLLQIKGRRHVQTRLVEPHSHSVNSGDSYILVTPDKVVNWNGKFSNVIEKAKAADIALFISQKRDLGYRSSSPPLTIEETKSTHVAKKNFWSLLEGSDECQECGPPDEDEDFESYIIETNMVYKVNNNTLVPYEEYWGKIPKVEMLKVQEVLVWDFGSELYVWHGQQVSMEQRKMGMKLAAQLWERGYDYSMCTVNPISPLRDSEEGGPPKKSTKRPSWAIFGKVNQNMETTLFKEKFFDWPESSRFAVRSKTPESFALKVVDVNDLKPYDAKLLIPLNTSPVTMMFEGSHVGRGDKWVEEMDGLKREFDVMTLEVNVWHVLEYDHFKLPKHSYGQFHDGDTYVVRWQYMITPAGLKTLKGQAARHSLTGRERCAYFFWQGHNSTVNEKGASALMTVELDEERGPQVRVLHGKEPPCFLNLFEGRTIIHIGKREEAETNTQGSYRLYLVRNEVENETCLIEVPHRTENLRSRSSCILLNVETGLMYIWHGAKSLSHTRKLAVAAAKKIKDKCALEVGLHDKASISITELEEGSEKSEFWSAVGSKDRSLYHSLYKDKRLLKASPRLFYMNSVAGEFEATEVLNPVRSHDLVTTMPFLQYDLYKVSQPGLFLLDDTTAVYLWQGWWPEGDEDSENVHTGSAQARFNTDKLCAMKTTIQYCKEKCPDDPPTAYLVYAGVEPLCFTNLFPFWEVDEEVRDSNLRDGRKEGETTKVEDVLAKLKQSQYTLEELQEKPLPEGVDPLKLETYLREEEFESVLDMSKDDFYAMPLWKQTKLKQKVGLF